MSVRTNLLPYPSFETDSNSDGLADGWAIMGNVTGTPTYSIVTGRAAASRPVGHAQRIQYTGVGGDSSKNTQIWCATPAASFAAGQLMTLSGYFKGSASGCSVYIVATAQNAANGNLLNYLQQITLSSGWSRWSCACIDALPATTDHIAVYIQVISIDSGDSIDITIDDLLCEVGWASSPYEYFDGDSVLGDFDCSWTAAAEASPSLCASKSTVGIPWIDGPWTRVGRLFPADPHDELTASVIKDGSTWKMWFQQGGVSYATAPSAYGPWTKYGGNPVLATTSGGVASGPYVLKVGAVFHMFVGVLTSPITHDHLTSTDGINWTLSAHDILPFGAAGTVDANGISRICVWVGDDGLWYMLYEANPALYPAYTACLATAVDPDGPWTKYAHNPVFGGTDLCASPTDLLMIDGGFYTWFHGNCKTAGVPVALPTDIARAYATSPQSWTYDPTSVLVRSTADEGTGLDVGQVADACTVLDGGTLYMFYTATDDGTGGGGDGSFMIKLATASVAHGLTPVVSRTVSLASGSGQNFTMTAGEHVVVRFTTDVLVDEVASAEWVAAARADGTAIATKEPSSGVTITGNDTATVTVELTALDTSGHQGLFAHQLWLYDSVGDGIAAATGIVDIQPSEVQP